MPLQTHLEYDLETKVSNFCIKTVFRILNFRYIRFIKHYKKVQLIQNKELAI